MGKKSKGQEIKEYIDKLEEYNKNLNGRIVTLQKEHKDFVLDILLQVNAEFVKNWKSNVMQWHEAIDDACVEVGSRYGISTIEMRTKL